MGVISLTMIRVDWICKGNGEAHHLSIKNICMKVRLYHDERVSAKDAPDSWSIYCPYPKKYQRVTGIKGVYLGCKPIDGGLIRCCWESMEVGQKVSLGKRMALSSTPKAFQVAFRKIECVYQHACQVDTLEAWGKFQRV